MNTDYSYCSGVTCSIRKSCKRYLPDPPDTRLQWFCPKCYQAWYHRATYYPEDAKVENRNFEFYKNIFGL